MDEIVNQVQQRTGISHDQAQQAVQTVLSFLKERLPAPVAGQIDTVLSGQGGSSGMPNLGDVSKDLGGMFGGGSKTGGQ